MEKFFHQKQIQKFQEVKPLFTMIDGLTENLKSKFGSLTKNWQARNNLLSAYLLKSTFMSNAQSAKLVKKKETLKPGLN